MQVQEGEQVQKNIYNFIVLTSHNLYSIQTDVDTSENTTNTKKLPPIDIKLQYIKTSKAKTTKIKVDSDFGIYDCFQFKKGSKGSSS